MIFARKLSNGVLLLLAAIMLTGCGGPKPFNPDIGTVTGTVTMDGKPLADANIVFIPIVMGPQSTATTDASGKYKLIYTKGGDGAVVGEHAVSIRTVKVGSGEKETLPEEYNDHTTLTAKVKQGENTIDFEL